METTMNKKGTIPSPPSGSQSMPTPTPTTGILPTPTTGILPTPTIGIQPTPTPSMDFQPQSLDTVPTTSSPNTASETPAPLSQARRSTRVRRPNHLYDPKMFDLS